MSVANAAMRSIVAPSMARLLVGMVVRHIRRDHDQRLRAAPKPLDHLGDLRHTGHADREWGEREAAQHFLQEGKLDFQRMLHRVRRVAHYDLRQVAHRIERFGIDAHRPEGRGEAADARHRKRPHRHPVRRPEENDALYGAASGHELIVSARRHAAGIDIAGVRHDEGLRVAEPRGRRAGAPEKLVHLGGERAWVARVEHPGYGGWTD
jgi:hypothetical protein